MRRTLPRPQFARCLQFQIHCSWQRILVGEPFSVQNLFPVPAMKLACRVTDCSTDKCQDHQHALWLKNCHSRWKSEKHKIWAEENNLCTYRKKIRKKLRILFQFVETKLIQNRLLDTYVPVGKSHVRILQSCADDTNHLASGLKAKSVNRPSCPVSRRTIFPVSTSTIMIVKSSIAIAKSPLNTNIHLEKF